MRRIGMLVAVVGLLAGQVAYAEEDASDSHFWGGVSFKYWMASYKPSGSSNTLKINQMMPTFAIGYDKTFITFTLKPADSGVINDASLPGGSMLQHESSFGFGYNFTPNFALVFGGKNLQDYYPGSGGGGQTVNGVQYTTYGGVMYKTLAALGSWQIPDTKALVVGNVAYGQGSSNIPSDNKSHQYMGMEIGLSYPVWKGLKAGIGYKYEKLEMPYPSNIVGLPSFGTAAKSGLFGNIGYSF